MNKKETLAWLEKQEAKRKGWKGPTRDHKATPSHIIREKLGNPVGGIAANFPKIVDNARTILRKHLPQKFKTKTTQSKRQINILAEHLSGDSQKMVERKYGVADGYIAQAMKRLFPKREEMENILEDLFASNAILCNQVLATKANDMSGKDAAIAAGIMGQRYIEIKRARKNDYKSEMDVSMLIRLESTLDNLKSASGKTIETESEVRRLTDSLE